jgi:hypothetical protein
MSTAAAPAPTAAEKLVPLIVCELSAAVTITGMSVPGAQMALSEALVNSAARFPLYACVFSHSFSRAFSITLFCARF